MRKQRIVDGHISIHWSSWRHFIKIPEACPNKFDLRIKAILYTINYFTTVFNMEIFTNGGGRLVMASYWKGEGILQSVKGTHRMLDYNVRPAPSPLSPNSSNKSPRDTTFSGLYLNIVLEHQITPTLTNTLLPVNDFYFTSTPFKYWHFKWTCKLEMVEWSAIKLMGKRTQLKTCFVGYFLRNMNLNQALFSVLLSASVLLDTEGWIGYHSRSCPVVEWGHRHGIGQPEGVGSLKPSLKYAETSTNQQMSLDAHHQGMCMRRPEMCTTENLLKTRRPSFRASFLFTAWHLNWNINKRLGDLPSRLVKPCQLPGPMLLRYSSSHTEKEGPGTPLSATTLSLDGGEQQDWSEDYPHFKS